jgi:hypothetical protein
MFCFGSPPVRLLGKFSNFCENLDANAVTRQRQIETEQKRQSDIISNAGVIDQLPATQQRTWNEKLGAGLSIGLDKSQYLLYGGMGRQAISSMFGNTLGSGISSGAMQAGIYSQLASALSLFATGIVFFVYIVILGRFLTRRFSHEKDIHRPIDR